MTCWRAMMVLGCGLLAADAEGASELELEGVLTLVQEIQVPAREAGVLAEVFVKPGESVDCDQRLARQDDSREKLLRVQAELELNNARRLADNQLKLRIAQKSHAITAAELKRAEESVERFARSVSGSELDRLRLENERGVLEVDQAAFDLETAGLAVQAKETALQLAEIEITRRNLTAPSAGVVVEVLKQPGEWVEPGEPLLRLVRMDRLRVESFLPARDASPRLVGREVEVSVRLGDGRELKLLGTITFVSPEVHPVNKMARVWAEIDNTDLAASPGLQATLKIAP